MELYPTHIALLNALLPPTYKIELIGKSDPRPRRSEAENLDFPVRFQPKVPEKRPKPELAPASEIFEDVPPRSEEEKKIFKIISELKKHPNIRLFLHPVDKREYPDYYVKITTPMDLSTVEGKLKRKEYETSYQFAMDMRMIWGNSFCYNASNSTVYSMTMELSSLFEKLLKGNENLDLIEKREPKEAYKKAERAAPKENNQIKPKPTNVVNEKPLGYLEKKTLCENIKKIDPKYLKGVLEIVKECTDIKGEELEFDIDKLPPRVCRELDRYTKNCLQSSTKAPKPKATVNVEGIKSSQEFNNAKLREVESQLEKITSSVNNEVYMPDNSDVSSESSSTSESEDDIPTPNLGNAHQGPLNNEEDFVTGYDFNG